jgi:hypothetical protein
VVRLIFYTWKTSNLQEGHKRHGRGMIKGSLKVYSWTSSFRNLKNVRCSLITRFFEKIRMNNNNSNGNPPPPFLKKINTSAT